MDDLISRQSAIDAVRKGCQEWLGIFQRCEENIKALPSTQPEQRWIPCSERLPENVEAGEEYPLVIFCTDKRSYFGFYEYYRGGQWWNYTADEDYLVEGVIAWMPLPEPYREVEE